MRNKPFVPTERAQPAGLTSAWLCNLPQNWGLCDRGQSRQSNSRHPSLTAACALHPPILAAAEQPQGTGREATAVLSHALSTQARSPGGGLGSDAQATQGPPLSRPLLAQLTWSPLPWDQTSKGSGREAGGVLTPIPDPWTSTARQNSGILEGWMP